MAAFSRFICASLQFFARRCVHNRDGEKQDRENKVFINVKDTGFGIDQSILPKLFSKFATKSKEGGGTGLGLYISKNIVEAHGGHIWAENNKDGKGATFGFSLPGIN